MNYLAHLFLTSDDENLMLGQMLGDFLEPRWQEKIPRPLHAGVRLHQQVDRYTDTHELFARSRRRLPDHLRRYGGVLVDVYYDHILARRWKDWSPDESLEAFAERAYEVLDRRQADLTSRLRSIVPAIRRFDWLTSYREIEGIGRALRGLSRRLSFPNPMAGAAVFLERDYEGFERDFLSFFPQLQAYVDANRPARSCVE